MDMETCFSDTSPDLYLTTEVRSFHNYRYDNRKHYIPLMKRNGNLLSNSQVVSYGQPEESNGISRSTAM
jgi:hypothetical protein